MKLFQFMWIAAVAVGLSVSQIIQTDAQGESAFMTVSLKTDILQFVGGGGQPLVGAKVLIGYERNDPFSGNELVTNAFGAINIPSQWKGALPVTVVSNGNVRTTYDSVPPTRGILKVSEVEGSRNLEVKGRAEKFGRLRRDGIADFGFVIPTFTLKKLLRFDISTMLSPSVDTIRVLGKKLEVPSNLVIPSQIESYTLPVHLKKPRYRAYVRKEGDYKFYALHGRFPFKQVIDEVRSGKSVFELINHFDFVGGGITDIKVNQNGARVNLPVNQMAFNGSVAVKAPNFPNTQALLSMAMANFNGHLVPTDLKSLMPNQAIHLKAASEAQAMHVLHILTNRQNHSPRLAVLSMEESADTTGLSSEETIHVLTLSGLSSGAIFNQLSFVLQNSANGSAPTFLDMVAPPQLEPNSLRLQAPPLPTGVKAVATYLVLSEIEEITSGKVKSERRTRLWEVFSPSWVEFVRLPHFNLNRLPHRKYRWEVMFLGRSVMKASFGNNNSSAGAGLLEGVTHITRSAVDI